MLYCFVPLATWHGSLDIVDDLKMFVEGRMLGKSALNSPVDHHRSHWNCSLLSVCSNPILG